MATSFWNRPKVTPKNLIKFVIFFTLWASLLEALVKRLASLRDFHGACLGYTASSTFATIRGYPWVLDKIQRRKWMYREIRRKDRMLNDISTLALLYNGEYGVLSTVDKNNQPYDIPVNYAVVDNTIFVHSAPEGHKLDNNFNSKVSFCVVGKTQLLPDQFSIKIRSENGFHIIMKR